MNILRHKKWHVRTKENVARVRRDEAKAAEEEKQRTERAAIADNEDRVRRLKQRTAAAPDGADGDPFGSRQSRGEEAVAAGSSKHVNFFAELEEQERVNLSTGNKEYAAEKKKEQDDWESKVGIMKRFAEDTKEYSKESEWWQGIPLLRDKVERPTAQVKREETKKKFLTREEKKALKKSSKKKKKRKKKKRRRHSSSSSSSTSSESSTEEEARRKSRTKVEALRKERLARERLEQARTQKLLFKTDEAEEEQKVEVKKSAVEEDRQRKYHSQFNPELAK